MQLNTRLILGYVVLAGLLITMAALSTFGLYEVDRDTLPQLEREEELRGGIIDLVESLEGLDGALLTAMTRGGDNLEALRSAQKQVSQEVDTLVREHGDVASESIESLNVQWAVLTRALDRYQEDPGSYSMVWYESDVLPVFGEVRMAARDLLDEANSRVEVSHQSVRTTAKRNSILIGVLVTVSLVTILVLFLSLRRNLLDRLAKLAAFDRICQESRHRRLDLSGRDDELTQTAEVINRLLDDVETARRSARGRHAWTREVAHSLLEARDDAAVILGMNGTLRMFHPALTFKEASFLAEQLEADTRHEPGEHGKPHDNETLSVFVEPLMGRERQLGWLTVASDSVEALQGRLSEQMAEQ